MQKEILLGPPGAQAQKKPPEGLGDPIFDISGTAT